jgi:hypothetical protein
MGDLFDEDGEILDFLGTTKTRVRGKLETDGMGRWWINPDEDGGETLNSIMPEGIELEDINDQDQDGDELVFWIDVTVHRPTGEFRDE